MRKLRLELENLQVESFATAEDDGGGGTVHAYASPDSVCAASGCDTMCSCYDSCVAGPCGSENQTYNESCVAGACPNSWDQMCETNGDHGCYHPITG
jgi:hypothetical protein